MLQRDRVRPDRFTLGLSFLGKAPGRPAGSAVALATESPRLLHKQGDSV